MASVPSMLTPADLQPGQRVQFVRESDPGHAPDDPLFEPAVPAGMTGRVVDVGEDHVRVLLDDTSFWPEPVLLWQEGRFPEAVGNTLGCLHPI